GISFDDVPSGTIINDYYNQKGVTFTGFLKSDNKYKSTYVFALKTDILPEIENIITASETIKYLNAYYLIVANFLSPVRLVSVEAYPKKIYSTSWAWMKAFSFRIDEYSNSLKPLYTVQTTNSTGQNELLEIISNDYNIHSVVFMGKGLRHVYFDKFSFDIKDISQPVPEPSTSALMAGSLFLFYFKRRKK
ncbi:MAG: PEP-CTERM sorting domain-containing protein, partial [Nitrospirae bacterium]|nr:PEP-CTERM sorting domain-containing protein [Nitrospirota bacterium]